MIWPVTVAMAAPAVPRAGKPKYPKMRIGSSTSWKICPKEKIQIMDKYAPPMV